MSLKFRKQLIFIILAVFFSLLSKPFKYYDPLQKGDTVAVQTKQSFQPYSDNRVHRAGSIWVNVSNRGILGNYFSVVDECTGKSAASFELPGGSGYNYFNYASLWCGGYLDSLQITQENVNLIVFQGPLVSTGVHYPCLEFAPLHFHDDPSGISLGRIKESSNIEGRLNCLFEDVYDPKATAFEQFSVMYSDKYINRNNTGFDFIDKRDHIPLGIEVRQVSYSWPYDFAKKFIIVDYTVYNRNKDKKDIYDFFVGLKGFSDAGKKDEISPYQHADDICGFIEKWGGYIDPATGERRTVDLSMVWSADNDGRNYITGDLPWLIYSEPEIGANLDGSIGIFSLRVLRNPNPNLSYSFNLWTQDWGNESFDWGPRWKTGLHADWQFDLTMTQKGYDDTNYDDLTNLFDPPQYLYGGRTEGSPAGDRGRYMVMSNDEFDYNQTAIREVYLGMDAQADGTPIPQAGKWQKYTTPDKLGQEGFADDIIDGYISDLNDIANGFVSEFLLGFGPLGYESYVNVATDLDHDGIIDSYIPNKKVWKFAYGDSLKLTLAFMVSEHFHTSLEQDPNYRDSTVVDLTDGLDVSLYDQGWYDAFYNVVWAERVYDTPMYDTPVTRHGITRGDGWYGEDVGADGLFGDPGTGDMYCWWLDAFYPGPDEGEGDFEITTFTNSVSDIYGFTSTSEDNLLPFGRLYESQDGKYGPTGDPETGEGWGYMVKYDKLNGEFPQGTWVRYGFDNDRLDAGDGVPDFRAPSAPPSPKIKVTSFDTDIIIEWTSHEFYYDEDGSVGVAGPEFTYNRFTRLYDFEGYNIEISPDRRMENFTILFRVDRVNYIYQNVSDLNDFLDNPIPADTLAAYPDLYPPMTSSHGRIYQLVPFGDNRDLILGYEEEGLYTYSCTVESSSYPEWGDVRNYKFILHNQTPGEKKYVAVTSTGFGAPKMGVPPMKSPPTVNAKATVASKLTTTSDVIVVPNPYRGDVDYSMSGSEDPDGIFSYAEEYRRIAFLNIPDRCVIRIYTLAGDLVKVIAHNGNADPGTPYWHGRNGAYWNLITENQQAAVSGIYLFSVQDVDNKKDDFVGKFVIIK